MAEEKGYSYGKRPLWQWILLYIVIGGVIYALVYFFYLSKKGGYSYNPNVYPTSTVVRPSPTAQAKIVTDPKGMTLYIFDKDSPNQSTCYNGCAQAWPPYLIKDISAALPNNMTTVTRTDGTTQYAWMGKPLYYYATDQKPGDTIGDNVNGVWHVVKLTP